MNTLRKLRSPWVIVTLLLAIYAGSYFAASEYSAYHGRRRFKCTWLLDFYRPMVFVESKVRRRRINASYRDPRDWWLTYPPSPVPATTQPD